MKRRTASRLVSLLLTMCLMLTLLPTVALADEPTLTGATISAAITACTNENGTDSDWVKYIKAEFDKHVDTDSNAIDGSWFDTSALVTAGTCDVWDGSVFAPDTATTSLPATEDQEVEYKDGSGDTVLTVKLVGGTFEYHVWSAEALAYAMGRFTANQKGKIVLEKDMDLNGKEHEWPHSTMNQGEIFDGQNHTIYNTFAMNLSSAAADSYGRAGFIASCDRNAEICNVTFQTAYVIGIQNVAMIGLVNDSGPAEGNKLSNLHARNVVSVTSAKNDAGKVLDAQSGALFGRVERAKYIQNCSAENSVVFGGNHVGSMSAGTVGTNGITTEVSNCYSVGCSVFSIGAHSGGFISCVGNANLTNCFTDVELYGSDKTGVFTGAANGTCKFSNCYASGSIEGTLNIGGFIGTVENYGPTNNTFENCYTTALVGLRSGGASEGGFVGLIDKSTTSKFENCYAAGEVGSTDTEITPNTEQLDAVGGFVGGISSTNVTFTDCYYDKQTTAMRECGVGKVTVNLGDIDITDITGALTTDTEKSGAGLMNAPATTGFTGFTNNVLWNFATSDHYPELQVFSAADADTWGNAHTAALVRAYSKSSTAGVQLETWDYGLNETTGMLYTAEDIASVELPDETYDTVRDIVNGFLLTSNTVARWDRIGTADSAGTDGQKVMIAGSEQDVLSLKHQNGQWLCDDLTTGIEWIKVTVKDPDDSTIQAARRLRVIPTCAIDAGESAVITDTYYDHADNVKLLFSTAERMANGTPILGDTYDVTTGIFPDRSDVTQTDPLEASNALTEQQIKLMQHGRLGLTDENAVNTMFTADNDFYRGVNVDFMSNGTDNANGGLLNTYIYNVTSLNDTTGEIELGALVNFDDTNSSGGITDATFAQQFNGYVKLPNADKTYLVTYAWELADGRVLMDAKLVTVDEIPFHVGVSVYKNSIASTNIYTGGANTYAGDLIAGNAYVATSGAETDFEAKTYTAAAAAWKPVNSGDTLKSITLTLNFSGKEYAEIFENPQIGDVLEIPFITHRIIYQNGSYYTIPERVIRTYTLQKNGDTYFLVFNKEKSVDVPTYESVPISEGIYQPTGRTVKLSDVESDIKVDVVLTPETPPQLDPAIITSAQLNVTKTISGDTLSSATAFKFTIERTDNGSPDAVTMPSNTTIITAEITSGSSEPIGYTNIIFRAEGIYTFRISETASGIIGMTDAQPQTVTIKVLNTGSGNLRASIITSTADETDASGKLTFINNYSAPSEPYNPPEIMPNVSVTKASVHTISPNANQISYTLTAKNSGDATAVGIYIKDFVPEHTHFASVDANGKYGVQDGKEYVSYFIERLAAGETAVMTFTVTIDECIPEGTVIRNTGCYTITGDTTTPPPTIEPEKTTNTVADVPDRVLSGTGTAELIKVDANDRATTLSGARFQLCRVVGDTVQLIGTRATDKDGKISIGFLPAGSYYWVEISSPAGYKLDASKYEFSVSESELSKLTVTNTRADVPEWLNGIDHYAYVIGYPEGDVRPMNNITRAEAATIFFRLLEDDVRDRYMTQKNSFSDVNEGMWFNCAISTMSAMGIVNGYPDGAFDPNGPITRAEFAAIAARFDANGNSSPACFYDIYEHWGRKEISIAANNGWVLGYEDGTFHPDQLIRRNEAMAMVDRVLQRVPEFSSDLLDKMVKWPDNADADTWFYLYVQEATNSHFFDRKLNGYETWTLLRPVRDWAAFEK